MTLADLEESLHNVLPSASFDFDNEGQLIIYTDLKLEDDGDEDSELVQFVPGGDDGAEFDEDEEVAPEGETDSPESEF
jgi:hypothetical protein